MFRINLLVGAATLLYAAITPGTARADNTLVPLDVAVAKASESVNRHSIGFGAGTNGLGVDYAFGINRYLDLRAGVDFGSYKHSQVESDIDYAGKISFSSVRGMLDVKPFGGPFRISMGISSPPKISAKAKGFDSYEIGDRTYKGDLNLNAKTGMGGKSPYLGLGWGGTTHEKGFGMSLDMGVIFGKSPKVKYDVSGMACDATADEDCDPSSGFEVNDGSADSQRFHEQLVLERDDLEDKAKDFHLWPVVRVGINYRF